jgi:hypothetical protein
VTDAAEVIAQSAKQAMIPDAISTGADPRRDHVVAVPGSGAAR